MNRYEIMKKAAIITMLSLASMLLLAVPASADKFVPLDGLVVRYPEKARVGRNFNIGIYVPDTLVETNLGDGSEGDYELAELYISVSGPGTCTMWNDWFEAQALTIGPTSDLIVAPYISGWIDPDGIPSSGDEVPILEYSMEYDMMVSKLADVAGWTGNVVCKVGTLGGYTFTLTGPGAALGSFTIDVG